MKAQDAREMVWYESREIGSPSRLMTGNDEAGLPSEWNHSEAQNEVEEGKQEMTPPRE